MSQWLRLYSETLEDPKVQRLSDALFKTWINLLCLAARNEGWLPPIDDVAFSLRISGQEARKRANALIEAGLIDNDNGTLRPHNWNGRQFKNDVSNERVKRFRERHKKPDGNVTETSEVTPPETEAESYTEQKERISRAQFSRFWEAFPNKVAQPAAEKAFYLVEGELEAILAGVLRYVASKPPDRAWLSPAKFLQDRRWEDVPASPPTSNGRGGSGVYTLADGARFQQRMEQERLAREARGA